MSMKQRLATVERSNCLLIPLQRLILKNTCKKKRPCDVKVLIYCQQNYFGFHAKSQMKLSLMHQIQKIPFYLVRRKNATDTKHLKFTFIMCCL